MAATVDSSLCCLNFGDKLAKFEIEYNRSSIDITCELYTCNVITRRLETRQNGLSNRRICVARGSLSPKECEVTIADYCNLTLTETNLKFPFLLIRKSLTGIKKGSKFILIGLLPKGVGLEFTKIGAPLSMANDTDWGPYLANGPALCWALNGHFYLNLFHHDCADFLCHSFFICDKCKLYRVVDTCLNFTWDLQPAQLFGRLCLVVYAESKAFTSQFTFSALDGKIDSYKTFEFPENSPFHSCLKQFTASRFVQNNDSPIQLLLTNSLSQIMLFNDFGNRVLSNVCKIPFCNARDIQIYKGYSKLKGYCIVTSLEGKSCILDLHSFKVVTYNDTPFTIFIGDFLHLGDLHLLFLRCKAEDFQTPFIQRYFEITDVQQTLLAMGNNEEAKADPSLLIAEKALQSRLIAGKSAVSNAESELCRLTTATNDIAFTLQSLALGEEQSFDIYKPYLFGLLTGKHLPITHEKCVAESHSCKPLDVGIPWQRILEDKWVVGVNIKNCSNTKLWNFHLILTTPFQQLEHDSKVFLIKEKYYSCMPTASPPRERLSFREDNEQNGDITTVSESFATVLQPGQSAILTTALSSDLLGHREEIACNIVVTFNRKSTSGMLIDAVTNCSPFIGAMKDVLAETYRIKFQFEDVMDALRDLAALDVITKSQEVTMVSKATNLYDISKILEGKLQFTFHPKLQLLYWDKPEMTYLKYMWIEIQCIENSFKCHCNIHARNSGQLFKLLHYLYQYLPEDILILPQNQDYEASFPTHLMREANLVTNFFGAVADKQIDVSEVTCFKTVEEARKSYEQRKRSFDHPPNPYANIGNKDYKEFREKLLQYELASDKAFISILNKKPN